MKQIFPRSMFIAPKGYVLLSWDLSQAESWVVAYLANEQNMKWSLANSDIHLETACVLYNKTKEEMLELKRANETQYKSMRYIGKRYNHASAYRMGYLRAAQVINADSDKPPYVVVTNAESKHFSESWTQHYQLRSWWSSIEEQLNVNRTLTTPYGRSRTFFAAWGNELFKEATAFVPQSTVADHLNGAVQQELGIVGGLREIYRRFVATGTIKICNQSHDSIIAECPTGIVNEISGNVTALLHRPLVINNETFTIPVDCEIGERWGELEKVRIA